MTEAVGPYQALKDLVMAWARDAVTGEPRYILEIDDSHRGAKCGCECPSCGKPLIAVNAAKTEFLRRPHFRHPEGAQRDECLILAARAAVLRQLQEGGWIDLPRRRISARVAGLSGDFHEAFVEEAPVRLRVSQVNYSDRATALIFLDDGRQIRVELTGTAGKPSATETDGVLSPTIYLAIDDPTLAALGPEELRRRARLLPEQLCWRMHWNDDELLAQAQAAARARAQFFFDDVPDWLNLPEGMPAWLRRETVLHHEVKRILEEVGRLTVPEVVVVVELTGVDGQLVHGRWSQDEEELRLACIQSEVRHGRLIPDLICESFDSDGQVRYLPLLIEVTVTNRISQERLRRIRSMGEAALEIDLSLAGGRVNRSELRQLVIDEVATKRWLFFPDLERERSELHARLAKQIADERTEFDARSRRLAERRTKVLATPVQEIATEYLDSMLRLSDAIGRPDAFEASRAFLDAADKLATCGYSEAADDNFIGIDAIFPRVLSIMLGRPVNYPCGSLLEVLRAIRQRGGPGRSTLTICLIAIRAYPPVLKLEEQAWLDSWAAEVRHSIQAGETIYLRDPKYDRLLSLLFPEMAPGLSKPFGKRNSGRTTRTHDDRLMRAASESLRGGFWDRTSNLVHSGQRVHDTSGEWWLQGSDLDTWKRENPEAARAWFDRTPRER